MDSEKLLSELETLGENYSSASRNEQEQYILDLINNLLGIKNLKDVLLEVRSKTQCARISRAECPLCSTELNFVEIRTDNLEAWGRPVQLEPERIAVCPQCDWQS